MRYRVMRLLVFFDLPTVTAEDRKRYRWFRNTLIQEGFLMIQESVYVRIASTRESAEFLQSRIAQAAPNEGLIQTLIITEKQYTSMKFITGESSKDERNNDRRLVVI